MIQIEKSVTPKYKESPTNELCLDSIEGKRKGGRKH
jgi:hypothetical protein